MESRRQRAGRRSPGSLGGAVPSAPGAMQLQAMSSPGWAHIQALIDSGGQIMIGTIVPIHGAAIAHDGTKTLVMLKRRPGEAIHELLARLDVAIATAKATGSRVDEINVKSSDIKYEF